MARPTAAMLVIGDEILAGRTREGNMHHLAGVLSARGMALIEARIVPDEREAIVEAVRALSARADHLFTSGGIGPTHDDITADAVAAAFGVAIGVREDARARLAAHYRARDEALNAARLRMARIPEGAVLIDNAVSAAPGFSLGNVHVMAGVPRVFEAMLEGLLGRLPEAAPMASRSVVVRRGEGEIAGPLAALAEAFPELQIGSYPFFESSGAGAKLVVSGEDPARVELAVRRLAALFPEAFR